MDSRRRVRNHHLGSIPWNWAQAREAQGPAAPSPHRPGHSPPGTPPLRRRGSFSGGHPHPSLVLLRSSPPSKAGRRRAGDRSGLRVELSLSSAGKERPGFACSDTLPFFLSSEPPCPHAKLAAGSGAGHFVRSTVRNEFVAAGLGLLLSVDFSCSFGRSMACLIFLKICRLQGTMRRLVSTALVARGLVRSCRASTAAVRLANPSVGGFHSCYLSETV